MITDYAVVEIVKLDMAIILDVWEHFSIQNVFVVAHVVIQLLNMRYSI